MKKPLKVLSASSLVAVFAVSGLTPVAAAEAPVQKLDVSKYIIQKDNVLLTLEVEVYKEYLAEWDYELPKGEVLYGVSDTKGEHYTYEQYKEALAEVDYESTSKAIILLSEAGVNKDIQVYEGIIDENLNLTWNKDEQPEDRLNETFFYNFAA